VSVTNMKLSGGGLVWGPLPEDARRNAVNRHKYQSDVKAESLTGHLPNTNKILHFLELTCVTGLEVPRTGYFTFIVYGFNEENSHVMGNEKNLQVLLVKTPNSLKFQALLIYTTEGLSV